ncbi:MAG: sigma-70 family RNA polymerase sigma factor [Anaerolineae bacterium]|nr:sigma-70 family RNA polymerase sigma factor [Anaerolineae bacterium]MBL6966178.1 sigma-70 family RNA polymerase sigma factor [Anaerolineales bacterium]
MPERTNAEWLADLRGPENQQAITDLRVVLIRGLSYSLSTRLRGDIDTLVEDFAQEALLKILNNLDTFRGESKLTTWAQKIAVRVAYSELRRKRWQDISIQDLYPEDSGIDYTPAVLTDPGANPEMSVTQRNILEMVLRLIQEKLTEKQRQAMIIVMSGGLPLEEAARQMGTNRNALYKLIHDARKRLKEEIEAEGLSADDLLAAFGSI